MSRVFVDSGAWIALLLPHDKYNPAATSFFHSLRTRDVLITSNYVVSETLTWLRYREPFETADRLHDQIEAARRLDLLEMVWIDEGTHEEAWSLMKRHPGQRLSHCDCSSFVVCRERSIDFVFAFDGDFRDMGFEVRP